jgi:DNA-binding MarR family transcriptional regulator
MNEPVERYANWPTPALLRRARDVYRSVVRTALVEAGYDDMPRDGAYVVGGVARAGAPLGELIKRMGVSKQAGGQLVDTLVARGYLDRSVDAEDRRRLTITLTERGRSAAAVVRETVDQVDAQLVRRVGAESFANTLATLASLVEGDADLADFPPSR